MLTFREQAAIAIASAAVPTNFDRRTDAFMSDTAAVQCAQELAEAACKAWGHQFSGEIHDESECERCGVKYLAIPPEES